MNNHTTPPADKLRAASSLLERGTSVRQTAILLNLTRRQVQNVATSFQYTRTKPVARCKTCGGRVIQPCLACKLRSQLRVTSIPLARERTDDHLFDPIFITTPALLEEQQ